MPCYQQRTTTMAVEAANLFVMTKALEALGLKATHEGARIRVLDPRTQASGYFEKGVLRLNGETRVQANDLKREYSRQSITQTAKSKGWQLRFKSDGKIEATKRRLQ